MAKFDYKRPGDEQTLEGGGGGGGGYSSKNDMRKLAGMVAAEATGLGYLYKGKKDFEAGVDKLAADRKYEKSKNYSNEGRGKKVPDTTGTSEEDMGSYSPRRATLPSRPGQNSSGIAIPPYSKDEYGNIIENQTGKVSRTIFSAGQEGNADRSEMKRGGQVKKMAKGGSASARADGCAQRGKTKGRFF
jgi:hypothetical protein